MCKHNSTYLPNVTFAIPTLNSSKTLDRCLQSIINQDYPNIEIVIVDGYSHDLTIEIAKKYTDNIYFCRGNLGKARQISVEKSTGEILALIDSDIFLPHRKWLEHAIKPFFNEYKISTVWPINTPLQSSSSFYKCYSKFSWIVMKDRYEKGRGVYGGTNALFRKDHILSSGGFDIQIHWGEDFSLAKRLQDKGFTVVLYDDALIHHSKQSVSSFLKKQFLASKTFNSKHYHISGLTPWESIYEHVIIGGCSMIKGIIFQKEVFWIYFPLILIIRLLVFGIYFFIQE